MRRTLFLAFASALLVLSYLIVFRMEISSHGEPARFIPADALFSFQQRDGVKALSEFASSPLGQQLAAIDFVDTGNKIGMDPKLALQLERFPDMVARIADDRVASALFGRRFTLALLPPLRPAEGGVEQFIRENVVLVCDPEQPAELLATLGKGYARFNEHTHLAVRQYGRHQIHRLSRNGETLSYAVVDGSILLAVNERQLRRCLDAFDGDLPSLAGESDYQRLKGNFSEVNRFIYFPLQALREFTATLLDRTEPPYRELIEKELATTIGFTAAAYGSQQQTVGRVVDRIEILFQREQVSAIAGRHLDITPAANSMLDLTTLNPMLYYWSNVLVFRDYLPSLAEESDGIASLATFTRLLKERTGKSIEEVFDLLGNEISMLVTPGGGGESYFSIPRALFFLRATDPEELRRIIEELCIAYDVQLTGRNYGPVDYIYWTPAPEDGLRPLYGFWDDLFFFGNSSNLVKEFVDARQTGNNLLDNQTIRRLDPGLQKENNSVVYIDTVAMLELAERVIGLLGTLIALEEREIAGKVRVVIADVIRPLLKGAKMYQASVSRSYFTADTVVVESVSQLAGGGE